MAQKISILLQDDLDGSEATSTVAFGLDGELYEIDLNTKHEKALRKIFSTYTDHARKVPAAPRSGRKRTANGSKPQDLAKVRSWLRENGYPDLKDRGRVPAEGMVLYRKTFPLG